MRLDATPQEQEIYREMLIDFIFYATNQDVYQTLYMLKQLVKYFQTIDCAGMRYSYTCDNRDIYWINVNQKEISAVRTTQEGRSKDRMMKAIQGTPIYENVNIEDVPAEAIKKAWIVLLRSIVSPFVPSVPKEEIVYAKD